MMTEGCISTKQYISMDNDIRTFYIKNILQLEINNMMIFLVDISLFYRRGLFRYTYTGLKIVDEIMDVLVTFHSCSHVHRFTFVVTEGDDFWGDNSNVKRYYD